MKHDRHTDSGADKLGNVGATDRLSLAESDIDALGAEYVDHSPAFVWINRSDLAQYGISRRLEHLPGTDDSDDGDDVLPGADAAARIRDGARDRTRSRSAGVRRLARESLLRHVAGLHRSAAGRGAAGAVVARRRARRDLATAALIRAGI